MAKTITIEITDAEYQCLEYVALDPKDFMDNAATARAQVAKDETVSYTHLPLPTICSV